MGGSVNENLSDALPSGAVRAFHLRTGRLAWNFGPGNPEDTAPIAPGQTFNPNVPNNWSMGSHDPDLNLVHLRMGIGSPDQYGGSRTPNDKRFGTSVMALDTATGTLRWVYQTVRHDIWHHGVPARPSLIDLTVSGRAGAGPAEAGRDLRAGPPHGQAGPAGHRSAGVAEGGAG